MVYKEWCIPRIHRTITEDFISNKMSQMNVGKVINVKNIALKNQSDYCRSIIKMECDKLNKYVTISEKYQKEKKLS